MAKRKGEKVIRKRLIALNLDKIRKILKKFANFAAYSLDKT